MSLPSTLHLGNNPPSCILLSCHLISFQEKDTEKLEADMVQMACRLEASRLRVIQRPVSLPSRQALSPHSLSHDQQAVNDQVALDVKLLRKKVQALTGAAGVARLDAALLLMQQQHEAEQQALRQQEREEEEGVTMSGSTSPPPSSPMSISPNQMSPSVSAVSSPDADEGTAGSPASMVSGASSASEGSSSPEHHRGSGVMSEQDESLQEASSLASASASPFASPEKPSVKARRSLFKFSFPPVQPNKSQGQSAVATSTSHQTEAPDVHMDQQEAAVTLGGSVRLGAEAGATVVSAPVPAAAPAAASAAAPAASLAAGLPPGLVACHDAMYERRLGGAAWPGGEGRGGREGAGGSGEAQGLQEGGERGHAGHPQDMAAAIRVSAACLAWVEEKGGEDFTLVLKPFLFVLDCRSSVPASQPAAVSSLPPSSTPCVSCQPTGRMGRMSALPPWPA